MMELLQEILFTGAVSFLFAILIAKFVSSSVDHRHGYAEVPAPVGGGLGGEYVVIEEGTRGKAVEEELHGSDTEKGAERLDLGVGNDDEGGIGSPVGEELREDVRLEGGNVNEVEEEEEEEGSSPFDEEDDDDDDDDDDWEGIERSAIEKLFDIASAFAGSPRGRQAMSGLSSELQLQFYGLHKIATEGPCYEAQPLALKISARSKWHAWQKLGNMNPEMAMEKYILLLTENIPEWTEEANVSAHYIAVEGSSDSAGTGLIMNFQDNIITAQPIISRRSEETSL